MAVTNPAEERGRHQSQGLLIFRPLRRWWSSLPEPDQGIISVAATLGLILVTLFTIVVFRTP